MSEWIHKVQYYETDQMGIVHHSNYIRWFEEARVVFIEELGLNLPALEAEDCFIPVISAQCQYKKSTRFGESVKILVHLREFGVVRFRLNYEVVDTATGELRATGETEHCFINGAGRPVSLKKKNPALFDLLRSAVEED